MTTEMNYNAMTDDELLKLVIREKTGTTIDSILNKKQIHEIIFDSSAEEIVKITGSRKSKAEQLIALQILIRRLMTLLAKSITKITSPQDIVNYLRPELYGKNREHFMVILLDTKNQIIKSEVVSIGTLNASLVHPREVFSEAIRVCANSVILSHNHPSGIANPSTEDQQITKRLVESGKLLGINILDHVIISDYDYYSFKENGEI